MNRGLSIWLDTLRVFATLLVLISHLAYPRFTQGELIFIREWNLGSDAVILFFVVSGFVIAYASDRDKTLGVYSFNRLSRLWIVMLPALLLTFVFDRFGYALSPQAYPGTFFQPLGLWDMLARGLSFSNEWAVMERVRLGTNGPLWSLSYEAAYYLLFGLAVFLRGALRWVLVLTAGLLIGPRVLMLMPAWLMGVWLWHAVQSGAIAGIPVTRAWLYALAGPVIYVGAQELDLPGTLAAITAQWFEPQNYRDVLVFSDEALWNVLVGGLAALHILGMARLMKDVRRDVCAMRWWAGASFSIYVTHYPALHLLDAAVPDGTAGRGLILFSGALIVGLIFAQIFERHTGPIRRVLIEAWAMRPLQPARHG